MRDQIKNQDAPIAPTAKVGLDSNLSNSKSLEVEDFLQSGWRVATALLVPALLAIWIDKRYQLDNWLTTFGVILGFVLAQVVAFRYVKTRFHAGGTK